MILNSKNYLISPISIPKWRNLNFDFRWGIFKHIIEIVRSQQDGNFILMKDLSTNKPLIKLFRTENLDEEEEDD